MKQKKTIYVYIVIQDPTSTVYISFPFSGSFYSLSHELHSGSGQALLKNVSGMYIYGMRAVGCEYQKLPERWPPSV